MLTNILIALVVSLVVVGLIVGGFLLYIYWWLVQRPTPKYDGTVRLGCVQEPVEILRDKHAIPHIYARNDADLWRAQGYVHAQDRLWQMEQNRRIAQGRLAELFGEAAVDADRFSRITGFFRLAQAEWDALSPAEQEPLIAYAEGVNAFMAQNPGRLAAEVNLLRFEPEPWQPVDSLALFKVMAWAQSINWESELLRFELVTKLDPIRASELEPEYPAGNPVVVELLGEEKAMRLLSSTGLLLNKYDEVRSWLQATVPGQGSNAWVVAPKASLTRKALLAGDPHMSVQIPDVWYENHLVAPGLEVAGASYCGIPGVFQGHNQSIAWAAANAQIDTQDLFVERRPDSGEEQFARDDAWDAPAIYEEEIGVRRQDAPHVERVVVTRHGPLISKFLQDEQAPDLALQWTGQRTSKTLTALLALNRAQDWEEFRTALEGWATPAQTFVFADVMGNIGYQVAGDVPVRAQSLGLTPAPGWQTQSDWHAFVPKHELPAAYNPESGRIVAANHKLVGDDYPHFLGIEFDPGWRARHLEETLLKKERYSVRDMEDLQLDNSSKFAVRLNAWLTTVSSDDPWEKVGIQELRKWNHRMDAESIAALIFQYAHLHLLEMVFGDKLGEAKAGYFGVSRSPTFLIHGFAQRASIKLLELLDEQEESIWYADVKNGRSRARQELLGQALAKAIQQIRRDVSDTTNRWNWGRMHQVRYVHPLGSVALFRRIFNRGPFPVGGDATTPNATAFALRLPPGLVQSAPVYRQIYEVGEWDRAQSVIMTGQSGHPLSDHYTDQMAMWHEGVYHVMPWTRDAVRDAVRYRTILQPVAG